MRKPLSALPVVLLSTSALAAPPHVEVEWIVDVEEATCPPASAIVEDVRRRIDKPPARTPGSEALLASAHVVRSSPGLRVEISLKSSDERTLGFRSVESEEGDCEALAAASALSIALMVESLPDAESARTEGTEAEPWENEVTDAIEQEPPTDTSSEEPGKRWEWHLTLETAAALGLLPRPRLALGSGFSGFRGHFGFAASAFFVPARTVSSSGVELSTGLTAARLGPCLRSAEQGLTASFCLEAGMGAYHLSVEGARALDTRDRLWAAVLPTARLAYRWPVWQVQLTSAAAFPLPRRNFQVRDLSEGEVLSLYEVEPVGALAGISLGARFF